MAKHKKPTKEELEAKAQEAIDAEPKDTPVEPSKPKKTPKKKKVVKKKEQDAEPSKEIKEALKKEVKEKTKKLSASARENQKIYAKNRVINKALIEAEEAPEPTKEELEKEFKDWDVMSDTERVFAKETVISRNWRSTIKQAKDQAEKIEKWNESVDEFVEDPVTLNDNPDLEGKTEEFKAFAKEESNNSVPFNILVGAFLHEKSKVTPKKEKMFETGSGGPKEKLRTSDKISLEESRKLRENDYDKWKQLLKEGKIELDI